MNSGQKKKKDSDSESSSQKSIHVQLCPFVQEMSIGRDEYSSSSGSINGDAICKKGWCDQDGTPWLEACPFDEIDLLKKGLITRDCKRKTYPKQSDNQMKTHPCDEVALLKKGLISRDCKRQPYAKQLDKASSLGSNDEKRSTKRVGSKQDNGTLTCTEGKDFRTYELKTSKGSVVLESGKNHSYLISSFTRR